MDNNSDCKNQSDKQSSLQGITEYKSRNRIYNSSGSNIDKYRITPTVTHHEEYRSDDGGALLYSVSQRIAAGNSSTNSNNGNNYSSAASLQQQELLQQQQKQQLQTSPYGGSTSAEWDSRSTNTTSALASSVDTTGKDTSTSSNVSGTDKQTSETNTSGNSSVVSGGSSSATTEPICDYQHHSQPSVNGNHGNNGGDTTHHGNHHSSSSSSNSSLPTCIYLHSRTAVMLDVEDARTASADHLLQAVVGLDELGLNKTIASQVFALWMRSPLLEVQLKPDHIPYEVRKNWLNLIGQYSYSSYNRQSRDEPIISFQRNVFFSQVLEEKIKDQRILELLYEECRYNILQGRYPCEVGHYIMLGGIQARIELGPYSAAAHTTHHFRTAQAHYLPAHVRKSDTWRRLPISSKHSAEVRLLEQFRRIPSAATTRKLMRKYLEFCWSLPFYGAAFFEGQIEQPVRGLISLMTHQDIPVLVAINPKGVYVIDDVHCTVLIGLNYEDMSWDFARPSKENNPNCLPCLFLQFIIVENGARVSKVLQVFSQQAALMDVLIAGFVKQLKEKSSDETDRTNMIFGQQANAEETPSSITVGNITSTAHLPSLSNKLSKLTLATFDENGHCIGQMGSWSFSY